MTIRTFWGVVTLLVISSTPSLADRNCYYPPFEFHPEKNAIVEVPAVAAKGGACSHNFAEGPGYHFKEVSIKAAPANGKIVKTGKNAFLYSPEANFSGEDEYAFYICATKGKKSGCSLIVFKVEVKDISNSEKQSSTSCDKGPPEQVIKACTAIIDNTATAPNERSRALDWRGAAYLNLHDLDRAIADFTTMIDTNPNAAFAYNNRGLAYQWKNDFDRALEDYNKAIALLPNMAAAYANRGNTYNIKRDFVRAKADFDQAIALDPRLASAYTRRGLIRLGQNDIDGAFGDLTKAIELNPDDVEAFITRGNIFREHRHDNEKAFSDYDAAIRVAPAFVGGYINRGSIFLFARNEFENALKDLDKAVQLAPKEIIALRARGITHFTLGNFSAAAEDFAKTQDTGLTESFAPVWQYLAEARSGKSDKGILKAAPATMGDDWPRPVYKFLLGEISRNDLERIANQSDEKERQGRTCEAAFYIGEQAMLEKRTDDAKGQFKRVVETCPQSFWERVGALGELQRM